MCGICGIVQLNGGIDEEVTIHQMTKCLSHRGPDDHQVALFSHAHLGHRRLAVIDVSGGQQPMEKRYGDRRYVLVYNGELYNTRELRNTLQMKGYVFETTSDTEVLLTSYIEWGEECVSRLNGIFAFAVWEEHNKRLFCSRDRLGIKPFFYTLIDNKIVFASEIKALLAHPSISSKMTFDQLSTLFAIGPSRIPGETMFDNIKELKPAHWVRLDERGIAFNKYWDVEDAEHFMDEEETIIHVRGLIEDAVERQLISDVPLCTFLSGGLDSSLLTALAANKYAQEGRQLHTYSVEYEGNDAYFEKNAFQQSQDQYWIALMERCFQTEHHRVIVKQEELVDNLIEAMRYKDYPSMADIDSSLLLFCKEVRKDFTVALSGECADEVFGGYPWLMETRVEQFPWLRHVHVREQLLAKPWRERLKIGGQSQQLFKQAMSELPLFKGTEEEVARKQLFYLNYMYFMQTLLERKDRMSMAVGLEVRVPFSDHRLVEYVWNVPWHMKMVGGMEKGLLREAAKGILPDEVVNRKKNPYPKTYHPAYTSGVKQLLNDALSQNDSILHELFDKQQMKQLVETGGMSLTNPWFGQLMAGPQLLAYFVQLHYWFKNYAIQLVE